MTRRYRPLPTREDLENFEQLLSTSNEISDSVVRC
jgi:hypothetical protein